MQDVTIVGVDLMQVEKVIGRPTWGKVIGGGVVSGAWLGLFFGLLVSIVAENPWCPSLASSVASSGVISTTIPYAATRGQRGISADDATRRRPLRRPVRSAQRREGADMLARLTI